MMIIDWLSLIAIGFFSLRGLFQGMSKEFSSTFSWIIAIFASWYLGPFLLPFLEDCITNAELRYLLTYLASFFMVLLILRFLGLASSRFLNLIGLGIFDKLLGGLFGTVKSSLFLASLYLLTLGHLEQREWWKTSYTEEYTLKIYWIMGPLLEKWKVEEKIFLKKEKISSSA